MTQVELEQATWNGPGELRDMLVPVETLTPAGVNPRRGDVPYIADSLRRFGQMKPIVTDRNGTIVAGNHLWRAAVELLGWTHVAAVMADHTEEREAYLYGLTDNMASDRARYDLEEVRQVSVQLKDFVESADSSIPASLLESAQATVGGLERLASRADAPEAFRIIDPEDMDIEFRCGHDDCGYEWSGRSE